MKPYTNCLKRTSKSDHSLSKVIAGYPSAKKSARKFSPELEFKILIACEESQTVCKAFRKFGFKAYSCDLQECSGGNPEWHINGDAIKEAYSGKYDMMIAHPALHLFKQGRSKMDVS